jgi:dTDP-4-dehydrorhamnose 3,5-epimerase
MKLIQTPLPGVLLLQPQIFGDARGFFVETYNQEKLANQGFTTEFVQDNMSQSRSGVLRGLHYQWPIPQGKLVHCIQGEIWDVAVDIREDSPTFGEWHAEYLNDQNRHALYIPEGFAHGFCVISESALVAYKCTAPYQAEYDAGVRFDDPRFNVAWPIKDTLLSEKDTNLPTWDQVPETKKPTVSG